MQGQTMWIAITIVVLGVVALVIKLIRR